MKRYDLNELIRIVEEEPSGEPIVTKAMCELSARFFQRDCRSLNYLEIENYFQQILSVDKTYSHGVMCIALYTLKHPAYIRKRIETKECIENFEASPENAHVVAIVARRLVGRSVGCCTI